MMFPHKITVFNIFTNKDGEDVVTPVVIKGVFFLKDENTERNKLGLVDADIVSVCVPSSAKTDGAKYSDPYIYDKLDEEFLKDFYTFKKGDFIAFGEVSLEGRSFNEFKNEFGNIYEITGVSDYNYGGLKHFGLKAK